ncbi:hypothetical protein BGZ47_004853 [Haplosporangium gracile]|nr:hypothetical protein BGZ47_004853 [Haplosporangium gracile]
MPNLRLFDIVAPTQSRHLKAIFTSFPVLITLSIGALSPDDKRATSESTAVTNAHRGGTSQASAQEVAAILRELHVARWKCPPTTLSNVNIRFNSVTRLNLQLISGYKNLLRLLRIFPALQELQLKKVRDLVEEAKVNYTTEPSFSALKSIRLAKKAFSTPYSLNGLFSILPNLIEANLYTVYSQTLAIFVEHCPRIEILDFTSKSQYPQHAMGLQDLQKLNCAITGTPYLTEAEQASIKYIQGHFSQNITFPLTFDMPRIAEWDPSYTDEDNWDMWHDDEKSAFRKYSALKSVLCDVFDAITEYTGLDTVQQDRMTLPSFTQTVWTTSKRGRLVSSMRRPLKAISRVLSESQARWIHLPS